MDVVLSSKSPPQLIAQVNADSVCTSAKLREFIAQTNAQRLINVKWAGVFEGARGVCTLWLFWDVDKAKEFIARNMNSLDLLFSSDDD